MTLSEAIALQPAWIGIWLNIMMVGALILPLGLFIWKESRIAGLFSLIAGIATAVAVGLMYERLGYVKLLGLPHIILWTPLLIYFIGQIRREDMPKFPRLIMGVASIIISISLAFDYSDAARYFLGERTPLAMPA